MLPGRFPFRSRIRRDRELSGLCRMSDLKILNETVAGDDKLRFQLCLDAEEHLENVCLRMIVSNRIGQIVGMSSSAPFFVPKGRSWQRFAFAGNPLAAGEYSCDFVLVSFDGTIQVRHDYLTQVQRFRVVDDRLYFGQRWVVRNWGNSRLQPLEREGI